MIHLRKRNRQPLDAVVATIGLGALSGPAAAQEPAVTSVTFIHMNDLHAHLTPHLDVVPDAPLGETSDKTKIVEPVNALGIDVGVPGNWDFAYGPLVTRMRYTNLPMTRFMRPMQRAASRFGGRPLARMRGHDVEQAEDADGRALDMMMPFGEIKRPNFPNLAANFKLTFSPYTARQHFASGYANTISTAEIEGDRFRSLLEEALANVFSPDVFRQSGGWLKGFSGVEAKLSLTNPDGNRVQSLRLKKNQQPLGSAKIKVVGL